MRVQAIFYANPDGYPPIINSARVLAAAGHQVDILCRATDDPPNIDYPPPVTVRRIRTDTRSTWRAYLHFIQRALRLADSGASAFVGHDMHGLLVARLLATRYHRPLLYHCHDFAEGQADLAIGGRLVKSFEQRFARTADLVIVPDAERAQVVQRELKLQTPALVVANAPISAPKNSTERLRSKLQELGFSFDKILFRQGSIGPFHAIETTIQSIPYWTSDDWAFVVMGPGDSEYVNSLKKLAKELNVQNQFVVLPSVAYDEVSSFTVGAYAGHGLYDPVNINHQTATTSSNKVMEYMAAGVPLLVSDRPGLHDLVSRHQCGITADESDPASIAAAVNTLLGDSQRARQMGANAARAFDQEFRYDRQFAPVLAALTELASGRRS